MTRKLALLILESGAPVEAPEMAKRLLSVVIEHVQTNGFTSLV